jgi:hypothetical protein
LDEPIVEQAEVMMDRELIQDFLDVAQEVQRSLESVENNNKKMKLISHKQIYENKSAN